MMLNSVEKEMIVLSLNLKIDCEHDTEKDGVCVCEFRMLFMR